MYTSPLDAVGGPVGCCCSVFWLVLLAAVVLFFVKAFHVNRYSEESVLERWSAVLPGQANAADAYLGRVESLLLDRKLPLSTRRERIPVSLASGESYDFVVSEMSTDYSSFVSCVPAGKDLEVSWLIQDHMIRGIYRLPWLGPLLFSLTKRYTFAMGNKVRAFAGVTHACAVQAAEDVLDEAQADKSRLNRKTSGRLGPL